MSAPEPPAPTVPGPPPDRAPEPVLGRATRAGDRAHEPRTRRQWVTLALGVVVLVALCLVAGRWQWHRYESRTAQIETVEANYDAAPVPVDALLDGPGAVVADGDVWRPVLLEGRYVADATVLLRNRPVGGQPGYHVLVPFETDDGLVVVVDRGFVPLGADGSAPDDVPAPPAGDVTVTARLRADEPASSRGAPAGQVQAISTAQVLAAGPDGAAWADGRTVGAYGALAAEEPAPATSPVALPAPDLDPGSHLSYAFQWCVFAIGAVAGFLVLVRRERRESSVSAGDLLAAAPELDAATGGATARPVRAPRVRRASAEEEEDALIDAQLGPDER